jgi:hypothetical protein
VHRRGERHRLRELAAQHPEIPQDRTLPIPDGVSSIRSIATTSPGLAPRTTIGPAIGASGCPSQAGVNGVGTALMSSTSSKAPRTSAVNLLAGSDGHRRRRVGIDGEEYSVRFALMGRSLCVADA